MGYNRISTRWTGAGNGKVTALFAVRNNHQQYNNKSKLCWETKRERGRSGLRAMVKASRGSDPNAETKRGPKRRKGEWPFLLPIPIVSERICATERKQRNWKISSNRPFPPPSILSLSLLSTSGVSKLGFSFPPMFIVIAERAISAFWVDRRFGSTSTHVVERKEEGGMGLVSPKGFNPSRAIPL